MGRGVNRGGKEKDGSAWPSRPAHLLVDYIGTKRHVWGLVGGKKGGEGSKSSALLLIKWWTVVRGTGRDERKKTPYGAWLPLSEKKKWGEKKKCVLRLAPPSQ